MIKLGRGNEKLRQDEESEGKMEGEDRWLSADLRSVLVGDARSPSGLARTDAAAVE